MGYAYADSLGWWVTVLVVLTGGYLFFLCRLLLKIALSTKKRTHRLLLMAAQLVPVAAVGVEWNTDVIQLLSPALVILHLVIMPVIFASLRSSVRPG